MKAYKATDKNMRCRDHQFELNREFIHDGGIELCWNGFHFCKDLKDVFNYYSFHPYNKFFEVEIPDDAEIIHGDNKSVTNKIKFTRELSSEDIKELTNGECYVDDDGGYVENNYKYFHNEYGLLHRVDGPAVIGTNGDQVWCLGGDCHRLGAPAMICASGNQYWYQKGLLHRDDGPAITRPNGSEYWYQNDRLHRVDGPAVIYSNGDQEWWQNGIRIKKENKKLYKLNLRKLNE